jgi:hypothetical protein
MISKLFELLVLELLALEGENFLSLPLALGVGVFTKLSLDYSTGAAAAAA